MFAIAIALAASTALDPALSEYARDAAGLYSSAAQHRADPAYDEVEARVVRIWPERTDEVWLYQEQAIISQPGLLPDAARRSPYFQRIGKVTVGIDGSLRRDNFRIRDAARFVGGDALGLLGEADLEPPGCHNVIRRIAAGTWIGETPDCANTYKGAARMLSYSVLTPGRFVNWDRGVAADGRHVWGPRAGGYVFERVGD